LKLFRKAALLVLLVSSLAIGATDDERYKELQTHFICLCGCNMGPLNMCTMIGCGHSGPMRTEIKAMIDEGKTDEQITNAFVQKYGKWVLSAPTTEGFNITAWIMPFAALAAGALAVAFLVKNWRGKTAAIPAAGPVDVKYQDQVEEELKKFTPED
jgi:cytochrome c-type biogenesis protein CcmH